QAYVRSRYEAPQGELEQILAGIWQELLHIEPIGRNDNFFSLGGHSLHGIKLIARAAEKLDVKLPVTIAFQNPTIQAMAQAIAAKRPPPTDSSYPKALAAESGEKLEQAPATFLQVAHWNLYRLNQRRSLRQVASALRLRGRLNIEALRESLTRMIYRHDALRTQVVNRNGTLMQQIASISYCNLDVIELPNTTADEEITRLIEDFIREPVDVALDPLIGVQLLKLGDADHVLITTMEHIISDGRSMAILLRDLFTAYSQILCHRDVQLARIPVQFPDYAQWQKQTHGRWLEAYADHWAKRVAHCGRTRFPTDQKSTRTNLSGWGLVSFVIDPGLRAKLIEWSRARQTTPVMSALTAFTALVVRWCGTWDAGIQALTDGRINPEIKNTIGYFASALYLHIQLEPDSRLTDLLHMLEREYCEAHEHMDFGYLEAQVPPPEFTRNCVFNWIPEGLPFDFRGLQGSPDALSCSRIPFTHPLLEAMDDDTEPSVVLTDSGSRIDGDILFPLNRFSHHAMRRFGRNFVQFMEQLMHEPHALVADLRLS
ncbi:MAG TPA: condensation domain-containing protein, partial [Steroidobacteraceae bacterium]